MVKLFRNSSYGIRHWFDPPWERNFQQEFGIWTNPDCEEFALLLIYSVNSGIESQKRKWTPHANLTLLLIYSVNSGIESQKRKLTPHANLTSPLSKLDDCPICVYVRSIDDLQALSLNGLCAQIIAMKIRRLNFSPFFFFYLNCYLQWCTLVLFT